MYFNPKKIYRYKCLPEFSKKKMQGGTKGMFNYRYFKHKHHGKNWIKSKGFMDKAPPSWILRRLTTIYNNISPIQLGVLFFLTIIGF